MAGLYRDDGKYKFGVNRQAKFQERVVREARKLFDKDSKKRFRVFVTFKERSEIKDKQHVQQLAIYLSEIVLKEIANRLPTSDYPLEIGYSSLYDQKEVFSFIYIDTFTKYSDCSWMRSNVNDVELLNEKFLLNLIERKERKYESGYYSGCDRIWLLLYIHFFDPAMDQCMPSNLGFTITSSNFNKIILYKTIMNEVHQLYPLE